MIPWEKLGPGAKVQTPNGMGEVVDFEPVSNKLRVRVDDELQEFDPAEVIADGEAPDGLNADQATPKLRMKVRRLHQMVKLIRATANMLLELADLIEADE